MHDVLFRQPHTALPISAGNDIQLQQDLLTDAMSCQVADLSLGLAA